MRRAGKKIKTNIEKRVKKIIRKATKCSKVRNLYLGLTAIYWDQSRDDLHDKYPEAINVTGGFGKFNINHLKRKKTPFSQFMCLDIQENEEFAEQ